MNLLSSATVFSFFTLISRILGYLRDILIAIFLGTSIFADAFFVAFRLPILLDDYSLKEHLMRRLYLVIPLPKLKIKKKEKNLLTMF